jgi:hypothetical protein
MRAWFVVMALAACAGKDEGPRADIARLRAKQIADEWYPRWALRSTDGTCPKSVEELAKAVGLTADDARDPWGNLYELACAPRPVATSGGPDGKIGTADDITSR